MVRFKNVGMVDKDINRIVCAKSSKRNSEKGFTLVELIVVLVILAILAAAIVPALLGYTDHAKKKKYIATAEECLKASQAVLSDRYNDSSNRLTKDQRYAAAGTANVDPEGTTFKVWTARRLEAGITPVTNDNIGAFTIVAAIYSTGAEKDGVDTSDFKYVFYDGKEYTYYDTRDEAYAAAAGMGYLDSDSTTSTRINMWPFKDDAASTDNSIAQTETWEDDKTEISKTVTFHLAHENFVHGTVFKYDNGKVSEDKDITVTFKKNATFQPESEQCENLTDGSVVTDKYGNVYTLSLEEGFDELKWSAVEGEKGTLEWTKTSNTLLNEIFNGNVSEFYATTTKKTITKEVTFKALNINTLHFNPGMKDSITVNFTGFSNRYDIGKWSVNKAAFDNGEMSGVESLTNYGTVLSSREFSNGYNLAGWAYNDAESSTGYEMQQGPVFNRAFPYLDEKAIWEKVFSVSESSPEFTGIMVDGKVVNLHADENTYFGQSETNKLVTLEVGHYELLNILSDNFDDYNDSRIMAKEGYRFTGWSLDEQSDELAFYNDNMIYIKDYALSGTEHTIDLYAVSKEVSKAKLLGRGDYSVSDYPTRRVIYLLTYAKKDQLIKFVRDDYDDAVTYLNRFDYTFDKFTKDGEDGIRKGDVSLPNNVNGGDANIGSHSQVYKVDSGELKRFGIFWDGMDDEYPIPVFAYSKQVGGKYEIHWFSNEPSPAVDGSLCRLFNGCTSCDLTASCLDDWNYAGCTSTEEMFKDNKLFKTGDVDFRKWDLSGVTRITNMFQNCTNPGFTKIDMTGVDFASLTTMSNWLNGCTNINSIVLDDVNSPSITAMTNFAFNKAALTSFSARNWNAKSVQNLDSMFTGCVNLHNVDMSGANLSGATSMANMFNGIFTTEHDASEVTYRVDFSNADLSNVTNATRCFFGSQVDNTYTYVDWISLAGADLSSIESTQEMFMHQKQLKYLNLDTKTPMRPINCYRMFDQCQSLVKVIGLEKMDTSRTERMDNMFYLCKEMTAFDFYKWDYQNVKTMSRMLCGAGFETVDFHGAQFVSLEYSSNANDKKGISNMFSIIPVGETEYVYSNVKHVNFSGCNWGTIPRFENLFRACANLETVKMTGMTMNSAAQAGTSDTQGGFCYMFKDCTSLTTVKMNVTCPEMGHNKQMLSYMFDGCTSLKNVEFENVDFSKIKQMRCMFNNCTSYEYVDLAKTVDNWDVRTDDDNLFTSYKNGTGYNSLYENGKCSPTLATGKKQIIGPTSLGYTFEIDGTYSSEGQQRRLNLYTE